ncbi:MAG: peptide chain release factor 2 [Anaerolineales bacterium]|nr:peptide chain release factor 2 [Anaerolineales bacterium]MCB8939948.1 peptide chain release factor 2 [Ardenticatenaceae bacterium]
MDELAEKLTNLQQTVNLLRRRLDVPAKALKVAQLEEVVAAPGFWDDSTKAQAMMRELTKLRDQVTVWEALSRRLHDAMELVELGDEELMGELSHETESLEAQIAKLEFETLFSGQYDDENCILAIHAGAGGTEAQDWAQMLERMFMRWADSHGMVVDIVDESPGDEAGIKSVMMAVRGSYVYGRLQSERGVHRLVRISPYDSSSRRHTSFAKVEVWPDVAEDIEIEIDEKDLRIDRFKASGAGGQHVQKNETAVRITHIPTGIVVSCQNQRSLTQNREVAMKILKAQLFDLEQRKQDAEMAALKGEDVDAAWGSQIRSYVLHPYKMVKDHRTNYEVGNAQAVLDGRLDDFMEAYLKQKVGQAGQPTP